MNSLMKQLKHFKFYILTEKQILNNYANMSELSKMTLSRFISETECRNLLVSRNFQSIIRLKVFNGQNQIDLDKTVIISIDSTDLDQINECMKELSRFNFPQAKSFHYETTINEIRPL